MRRVYVVCDMSGHEKKAMSGMVGESVAKYTFYNSELEERVLNCRKENIAMK